MTTNDIQPRASVILPTRNRKDFLRRAIESSFAQTVPVEVIVLDDDSTDGTEAMVRESFPRVRYTRFNGANGPSFLRNRGAELATTEYLFPIDDDAEFTSPRTVEQTLADFSDERVGAVGIPFINVRTSDTLIQKSPSDTEIYVTSAFVGASHAIRKSVFQKLGGFREHLFYMGEESDLCIRMLAAGYVMRVGRADAIAHHQSPIRNSKWADLYGRRNDILFPWHNAPLVELPLRWVRATIGGLYFGFRVGRPARMTQGLLWGYASVLRHFGQRAPVSRQASKLFRRLQMNPALPLSAVMDQLPKRSSDWGGLSSPV